MSKNCYIDVEPEIVERATVNAKRHGQSLKNFIENSVVALANNKDPGAWITQKQLESINWAPSRITLNQMRRDGRLVEGVHYKRDGRYVFMHFENLKSYFLRDSETNSPATNRACEQ